MGSPRWFAFLLVLLLIVGCERARSIYGIEEDGESSVEDGESSVRSVSFFQNFDDFPATLASEIPGPGGTWVYSTDVTNRDNRFPMSNGVAGFRDTMAYASRPDIYNYFYMYAGDAYNTSHMGFNHFGYLELSSDTAVKGNSLRHVITGGKNSTTCPNGNGPTCLANGLPVHTKEEFLSLVSGGSNPVDGSLVVGTPNVYFVNTSSTSSPVPFSEAKGANRLSLYFRAPADLQSGTGSYPYSTVDIGPYSYVPKNLVIADNTETTLLGGHWYHYYYTQGGGWMHLIVDNHPQHNNGMGNFTHLPKKSIRNIGATYMESLFRFYLTVKRYQGFAKPEFSVYYDEIEFQNDPEPQNNETINSPSVMYLPNDRVFEIGFNGKYVDWQYDYASYEIRYAFEPITNANWAFATPVHILPESRLSVAESLVGKFVHKTTGYVGRWVRTKLADEDQARVQCGRNVYFAIKDISQKEGDGLDPVAYREGRDYRNVSYFDYEADRLALPLIKRLEYFVSCK
ncbi:MAG: hypothetical protein A2X94_07650 [Bdellovibrionales bacterium GWB1_55_8]|nr:MAG: hypothetical protein A2X94_07650 [Bdellovibrionales bacterium GWB1_55_8]